MSRSDYLGAAVLLLATIIVIAVCSNTAGNLLGSATQMEQMIIAGIAVLAIIGVGTELIIRFSDR